VDILPQRHHEQSLQQQTGDKTVTECTSPMEPSPTLFDSARCPPASIVVLFVKDLCFFSSGIRDTVIVEERSDAETSEAGPEESEPDRDASGTAAASSNSDDQPAAPGTCPRPTVTGQRPKLAVPLPQSGKM
jgi:protein O-mannose beta-1,4-N-acetylglucosaminyltransferase